LKTPARLSIRQSEAKGKFAQFPFRQENLDCDYFGTSLHKWLLAPIGTGMLYVRKNKVSKITPNVYTTIEEIDTFAEAMEQVIKLGSIPG
jgi:selenocysteine lyase/cysteine desulfurase